MRAIWLLVCVIWLCGCHVVEPLAEIPVAAEEETVILLHGMARSRAAMWILQYRLNNAGYQTLNFPYSSQCQTLDEISDRLLQYIRDNVKTSRYHLVAHSLGNIVIRNAFHQEYPPGLGRIVMIAPPNHPPQLAKRFKNNLVFHWIAGDSGQQLAKDDFYRNLPIPKVEFGIIAGISGFSVLLDQPSDGIVAVENTKLPGMSDWVLVAKGHSAVKNAPQTFDYVTNFLQHGEFTYEMVLLDTSNQ